MVRRSGRAAVKSATACPLVAAETGWRVSKACRAPKKALAKDLSRQERTCRSCRLQRRSIECRESDTATACVSRTNFFFPFLHWFVLSWVCLSSLKLERIELAEHVFLRISQNSIFLFARMCWITHVLTNCNRQSLEDRACSFELADLGLNFCRAKYGGTGVTDEVLVIWVSVKADKV